METTIRQYTEKDLAAVTKIWNEVVAEGNAFPQDTPFTPEEARAFFASQTFTGVAESGGRIVGFYILHPNNAGHCAHIANASYGVSSEARGTGMGERLVRHSLEMCRKHGFVGLQFNAVVSSNTAAIRLYEKLGFVRIGTAKNGYRFKDGHYEDLFLFNKPLI
ncbi:GNAT family N-acetyltransferase [Anaerotruncus colihominis]|uniref:Acetyltransferase, GNAT family n=1 Tax=Anaerotruncus colihominis DSM 17241 TaxID=445972 RepID=B0PHP3_9FIRM|nr:GNAT family N-acetyltransferase [Anaerotruncus colihominis]EDS09011.1 acetyltransferase, GNAT family [Anaerotruncus colihominis DSM 17241]UWN73572.1 GNAT family N-acetyltransferase [Anaerotruncus colihominis]